MRRSTAIILWTVAAGFIATCAIAFLEGAGCFAAALLDYPFDLAIGPLTMIVMASFVAGAAGGLVLAARGRLPGTRQTK